MIWNYNKFSRQNAKFAHFENFRFIQQGKTKNRWYIEEIFMYFK